MKTRYQRYPNLIHLYRSSMGGYKRLTHKQERELGRLVQKNKDIDARERLALSAWKIVTYWASRFQINGVEYLDLVQSGNESLLQTAERYNGSTRFATYATIRVKGRMMDVIRNDANIVRVVRERIREWKRIDHVQRTLSQERGRDAYDWEIARELNLPVRWVREILVQKLRAKSLDETVRRENGTAESATYGQMYAVSQDLGPEELLDAKEELKQTLRTLRAARDFSQPFKKRDGRIFCTYYGLNNGLSLETTFRTIAQQEDLTEARAHQICAQVLRDFGARTQYPTYSLQEFREMITKVHRLEGVIGEPACL